VDPLNLRQSALDFVNLARNKPALATDPEVLGNLEAAALMDASGSFAAETAPIAEDTWEAGTVFLGNTSVSERINVDITYPVMIVGLFPTLSVFTTGGATTPTLSDIDCQIDLNTQEYRTSMRGTNTVTTAAGTTPTRDGTFVTLAALSTAATAGARMLCWKIPDRTSQIGVTFRWKQFTPPATAVFKDTMIRLAFFVRPLARR
jgi:hypothetical protein